MLESRLTYLPSTTTSHAALPMNYPSTRYYRSEHYNGMLLFNAFEWSLP